MKTAKIISLLLLLLLCACGQEDPNGSGYASVNGELITEAEIDYFKSRYRADIINEYAAKYSIRDFSDFWDKDFDGVTPAQALEKRALDEAVSAKIKLVMMRENGIYEDISFRVLLEKAERFNAENANTSGVVGIRTVNMDSFYSYYVSTGEMELKNILAEGELKPSSEELAAAAENAPTASESSLISRIVSEKYDALIAEKISDTKIELLSGK